MKKLEVRIRFGGEGLPPGYSLVWNSFFSTKEEVRGKARYSLEQLLHMDRDKLREVYDEYFYTVYFRKYEENGLYFQELYDPSLLSVFGLSPSASPEDIKRRFRELAKKYHPDLGGSSEKMIELLEAYHKLQDS
jgi:DnaJ-domain-containing protein 1